MNRTCRLLGLAIFHLCGAAVSAAGMEDAQPIGFIRADITCSSAVTFSGTTHLTAHLVNISDAPALMEIGHLDYQQDFVHIGTMGKDVGKDAWGPDVETQLWTKHDRIEIVGIPPLGRARHFRWPKRDGIIILRDEGYARLITLLPGWFDITQTPPPVLNSRMPHLVVCATPSMHVSVPVLKPDAVKPGKPIIFDVPRAVWAPGDRLVPFTYSDPKLVPAQPPAPPAVPIPEHALELRVEVPAPVEADRDVTAIYLVGNTGSKPVWVVQNRMVPALATWEVLRDGKVLATIDGSALRPLLNLLPARTPLLLNPGEYLTNRRVLLASTIPLRKGNRATIRARLDVPWFPAEPQPQEEPKLLALEGTLDITVK